MCGIFGFIANEKTEFDVSNLGSLTKQLFLLSESRGKDSSGLVLINDTDIKILKRPHQARNLVRSNEYQKLISEFIDTVSQKPQSIAALGHARMVTNGNKEYHGNNQPVIKDGIACIHNGIIVNDEGLWQDHPSLDRTFQVDTEVLLALMRAYRDQNLDTLSAFVKAFQEVEGANSVALFTDNSNGLILATSNGSLYFSQSQTGNEIIFASEKYIVQQIMQYGLLEEYFNHSEVHQVIPCQGYYFELSNLKPQLFDLRNYNNSPKGTDFTPKLRTVTDIVGKDTHYYHPIHDINGVDSSKFTINDAFIDKVNDAVSDLRRCKKCLLPETFPFIEFDKDGICNYCHTYDPINFMGEDKLRELVQPFRRGDGKPDVLVPISGGRDSCYGMHYIKNVLDLNPVAYTYDWGLVTDLARRNISRMCGKLGIEHILISADIKTKRKNVRKNVQAWLHKPELGTVPLFMAGDKQFFYYSNMLKNQMGIDLVLYSMNPLERTDFKVGFCGINEVGRKQEKHYALAMQDRLHMMAYYGWHFVSNPRYINRSLLDSFGAFLSYYMIPKDYNILYEYLRWDEDEINNVLINEYNWETAPDTESTWRIGDGTASFYNYIYYTIAGFSENDTFRSNQIREGMIDRDEAIKLVQRDNQPRYSSMRWYADTIGFDFEEAIKTINAVPKLY